MKVFRLLVFVNLFAGVAQPVIAQGCRSDQLSLYGMGYTVRQLEVKHPLSFAFIVRHRMEEIRKGLPLTENSPFTVSAYEAARKAVEDTFNQDDSMGSSPVKLVVVTAGIKNCRDDSKTLDVVYGVFSTDPMPSLRASPERRQSSVENPATNTAADSTKSTLAIKPLFGYDDARRAYGGVDLVLKLPLRLFDGLHLASSESKSSREVALELDASKAPERRFLDRLSYHAGYTYSNLPAFGMSLVQGFFQSRFSGYTKPKDLGSSQVLFRYGMSAEAGNQQSDIDPSRPPATATANSGYRSVRGYWGVTRVTRYSEAAISYGIQRSGVSWDDLRVARHVGHLVYSRRQGGTHSPWDIQAQVSAGGISNSKDTLLTDRFFGGSKVASFIPDDSWFIPDGPIIRSLGPKHLAGDGFGGTSFASFSFTIGQVVAGSPLIPAEIEKADGFASGINAAEDTAERFFANDYLMASSDFQDFVKLHAGILKGDLDNLQMKLLAIKPAGAKKKELEKLLKSAQQQATKGLRIIRNSTTADDRGNIRGLQMKVLLNPSTPASLIKLVAFVKQLQPLVSASQRADLAALEKSLNQHVDDLRKGFELIMTGTAAMKATESAKRDMERPREVIDTLRHEVNRFSVSLVGLFDAARLWPDAYGTRYAVGGGARLSIVNVNFTAAYAVNPQPHRELDQGRGGLVFSLTYTNFFR